MKRFGVLCMFSGFALIVVRFVIGMVYLTRWTSRPVDPFIGLGIEQYCGICAIALMLLGFMIVMSQEKR